MVIIFRKIIINWIKIFIKSKIELGRTILSSRRTLSWIFNADIMLNNGTKIFKKAISKYYLANQSLKKI